jgi:hypothetical protein
LNESPCYNRSMLPPTSEALRLPETKPYFLWWTDVTVGEFKEHLEKASPAQRAYWLGALLREANTRDVWLFTSPSEIRALWPELWRHLGKSRRMWCFLLSLSPPTDSLHAA